MSNRPTDRADFAVQSVERSQRERRVASPAVSSGVEMLPAVLGKPGREALRRDKGAGLSIYAGFYRGPSPECKGAECAFAMSGMRTALS